VATAETELGTVLVDANGLTLYAFTPDEAGQPTCTGECAGAWPPALVEGEPNYGDLDPSVFSLVEHPEGGQQLKAGDWPLYTFAGDAAPGDTNGQGQGGVWYVVAPDGSLIR
jgi:predicted lipoprotein with Yx(FWY)xxD motif